MDVSIIIVNYNTKELTLQCLNSVFDKTKGVTFEVILVDNASSDGSKEFFLNYPGIKFIESSSNLGFGKANNLGYSHTTGKYVFLLNSDTILENNAIRFFYDYMESDESKSVGCVGGMLIDADGNYGVSYGDFPSISLLLKQRFALVAPKRLNLKYGYNSNNILKRSENSFEVDYISGADMFIRRTVIERCGLFDPDFFMYYEETEMQHRYRKAGYLNCIYTDPQIIHLEGGSEKGRSNHLRKAGGVLNSFFMYMKKTHNLPYYILFRVVFVMVSLPSVFYLNYSIKDRLYYLKGILSIK